MDLPEARLTKATDSDHTKPGLVMGTLLAGVIGICSLASALSTTLPPTAGMLTPVPSRLAAKAGTSTPSDDVETCEYRVLEKRALTGEHGLLVYGNADGRDSVVLANRILVHLHPGDLLADAEGSIER